VDALLEYDDGEVEDEDEYPECDPTLEFDPWLIPPHARPIFSTARFARPVGAKLPVRLTAGGRGGGWFCCMTDACGCGWGSG